mgnify:CR=1 FL=1
MRRIIADQKRKIKQIPEDTKQTIFVIGLIVVVAITAFSLGRLSVGDLSLEPDFVYPQEIVDRASLSSEVGNIVVASVRGTKYHYPWCSGAQSMNEMNKIEFDSIQEARAAGYTPAANCEGLK